MLSILVAFPKIEDANNIRNVIVRNGFDVDAVCTSGARAISIANELDGGIIICGYRFKDMHYTELNNYLPKGFEMLLVASPTKWSDCINNDIVCLGIPIKPHDLVNTLEMMISGLVKKRKKDKENKPVHRTEKDKEMILKAKAVLMDRNNMSEEEAHRYIQKSSMDSGTNMVETAQMILLMIK